MVLSRLPVENCVHQFLHLVLRSFLNYQTLILWSIPVLSFWNSPDHRRSMSGLWNRPQFLFKIPNLWILQRLQIKENFHSKNSCTVFYFNCWGTQSMGTILGQGNIDIQPMDPWAHGPMDQWTNGSMDQWTNEPMDQWTNDPKDQWANGPIDQ